MKIRVLGIAPYEGMKTLLENVAQNHPNIFLQVYVGNLDDGVAYAKSCFNHYDVILSRGGTAELIQTELHIPVISVEFSAYDILRAMKLAENYSGHYALVGFPSITQNTRILCELLQYHIDIYTISNVDETEPLLKKLSQKHYNMILCDMIMDTLARRYGLNSILITSGTESIEAAFLQLEKIHDLISAENTHQHLLSSLITEHQLEFLVFDEKKNKIFSSVHSVPEEKILAALSHLTEKEITGDLRIKKRIGKYMASISCKPILLGEETLYSFQVSFTESLSASTGTPGIEFYNFETAAEQFLQHFHGIPVSFEEHSAHAMPIDDLTNSPYPLLFLGEQGTGKNQIAASLYSKSSLKYRPFVAINFGEVKDKDFHYLLRSTDSPLYDHDITVQFIRLTKLSNQNFDALIQFLKDTSFCKRNRTFFTFEVTADEEVNPRIHKILEEFLCVTVHLPPLRERKQEISTIASLYISSLNQAFGKQIAGFTPEALRLLEEYRWPGNLIQFKRVLTKTVSLTTGPYISEQCAEQTLKDEDSLYTPPARDSQLIPVNLNQTLNSINHDVIRLVLSKYNNNQSKTSEHLGISRSTLWRLLKE